MLITQLLMEATLSDEFPPFSDFKNQSFSQSIIWIASCVSSQCYIAIRSEYLTQFFPSNLLFKEITPGFSKHLSSCKSGLLIVSLPITIITLICMMITSILGLLFLLSFCLEFIPYFLLQMITPQLIVRSHILVIHSLINSIN